MKAAQRARQRAAEQELDRLRADDERAVLLRIDREGSPRPGDAIKTRGPNGRWIRPLVWADGSPIGIIGLAALGRLEERGLVRQVRDGPDLVGYRKEAGVIAVT